MAFAALLELSQKWKPLCSCSRVEAQHPWQPAVQEPLLKPCQDSFVRGKELTSGHLSARARLSCLGSVPMCPVLWSFCARRNHLTDFSGEIIPWSRWGLQLPERVSGENRRCHPRPLKGFKTLYIFRWLILLYLLESYSFSLPCFVGQMLRSQFTSIPGTVFKGSKGERHEVSLSANNRKRTLFVRQLVSAIPSVEPTNFWTTDLVFHTAPLSKSLERQRHSVAAWMVGGKAQCCCNSLFRRERFFKEQSPEGRERKWW